MRSFAYIPYILIAALIVSANSSFALPNCQGDSGSVAEWNDCKGTLPISDGSKYVGEFQNGEFSGQGTYIFKNGTKYVGTFQNNNYYGQATVYYPDGRKFVGSFKNGKKNGLGTDVHVDGRVEKNRGIMG